ncbi:MAG: ATP-grasp domain-containing protein [Legionella longbeachae]|nr:ATP-grasp domain-containing protein [Legionella longbeachae]
MSQAILFVNVPDKHHLEKMTAAQKLGVKVFLVAPVFQDWVKGIVNHFIQADTTNFSETLSILRSAYQDTPFDGVITLLDKSVELVAAIAQEFNLPGSTLKAATTVKHKYKMREALREYGIPHPKFQLVKTLKNLQDAALYIGFPFIFKPVAASTSAAVFKIDSMEELEKAFHLMATCERPPFWLYPDEYLAEEFMNGQEISVEGVINRKQIHFAGITNKSVSSPGFTEWMHCFPTYFEPEVCSKIYELVARAIEAVKINDCAFHVEVMMTAEGPKIVEINSRLAGAFISSHLVPMATGIDLACASIQTALGEPIKLKSSQQLYACERNVFAKKNGTIIAWKHIDGILDQPGVKDFKILRSVGDYVKVPPEGYDNLLCAVITVGGTFNQAQEVAKKALNSIECVIE